jgi:antitoxin component of MazEF toxin-antitoxin module
MEKERVDVEISGDKHIVKKTAEKVPKYEYKELTKEIQPT